jgi:hypothetical protein
MHAPQQCPTIAATDKRPFVHHPTPSPLHTLLLATAWHLATASSRHLQVLDLLAMPVPLSQSQLLEVTVHTSTHCQLHNTQLFHAQPCPMCGMLLWLLPWGTDRGCRGLGAGQCGVAGRAAAHPDWTHLHASKHWEVAVTRTLHLVALQH